MFPFLVAGEPEPIAFADIDSLSIEVLVIMQNILIANTIIVSFAPTKRVCSGQANY